MSTETMKIIISRAVIDKDFRELLLGKTADALSGYDITEEERHLLENIDPGKFDALAGELDIRISRSVQRTYYTCHVETQDCRW